MLSAMPIILCAWLIVVYNTINNGSNLSVIIIIILLITILVCACKT